VTVSNAPLTVPNMSLMQPDGRPSPIIGAKTWYTWHVILAGYKDGLRVLEDDVRSEEALPTHVSRATNTLCGQPTPCASNIHTYDVGQQSQCSRYLLAEEMVDMLSDIQ
jgi:hypothetical protein